MKKPLFAALVAAVLWSIPSAARSQTMGCAPGSSPLITVINFTSKAIDLPPGESRSALVLCKDRRLVVWSMQTLPVSGSSGSLPPFPFAATLEVGLVSSDTFDQLVAGMSAAQIGLLGSCNTRITDTQRISLQVTWFGRGARTNTFDIGTIGGVPACSDGARQLFISILALAFDPGSSTIILE